MKSVRTQAQFKWVGKCRHYFPNTFVMISVTSLFFLKKKIDIT